MKPTIAPSDVPAMHVERDALRAECAEKQRQCDALKLALDAEVNKGVALRRQIGAVLTYLNDRVPIAVAYPIAQALRDALK